MKNYCYYIIIALLGLALSSCKSSSTAIKAKADETVDLGYIKETKSGSTAKGTKIKGNNTFNTLEQYLRTVPGLRVSGSKISIVGIPGNLMDQINPLFVVDRVRLGRDLASVSRLLNPNDIDRISVLKTPAETGLYGSEGAYGVIVIRTKK
ncbi:MAG: TonB-dependent receptor plug domain-containing protein [Bacteroidia bacterium]|nr:TonB-dependent receptor plug domain-containing protein [Bacteroidia bacterium]